jgi:hypothetical protein
VSFQRKDPENVVGVDLAKSFNSHPNLSLNLISLNVKE